MKKRIAIIGAGPAGLTAAYLMAKAGLDIDVFEKDPVYVGGISRTEKYKGYLFDIGGHRFFSKSREVEDFWTEILGDDMLECPRSSRIYYNKKFFSYPLVAGEALRKLGLVQSGLCVMSYLRARLFPHPDPGNFEEWVVNQFGRKLFSIFFKTYTEKVWGIPCREISADWAAQRIKGLSLANAIRHAIFKPRKGNREARTIKTLIDTFRYPRKGPGMMWEACRDKCLAMGVRLHMNTGMKSLRQENGRWTVEDESGRLWETYDHVLSTAPIRELMPVLRPAPPEPVLAAAGRLAYRDFITVVLVCRDQDTFTDNWIYIHDPSVRVGRIQNFKSWSPHMVPDPAMACYGLEYFCFEGDGLWNTPDRELIELARKEMTAIGLARRESIVDGCVVRQPKAYPVYDHEYRRNVEIIREGIRSYRGLYLIGRNGMHKYNNQDHSMMTAMLAARNIIAGNDLYDVWNVNSDAEYHEGGARPGQDEGRQIPRAVGTGPATDANVKKPGG